MQEFSWLGKIDTLLLGLWKAFHYSFLNRHIFASLQEAYRLNAVNLVEAVITRWLSHGVACLRCREQYTQIIESMDDIRAKRQNAEWIGYRSELLQPTVLQITFLEYVLCVTNALCFLLQSDRKDFGAISRAVDTVSNVLNNMRNNPESPHFKSFQQAPEIIKRMSNAGMKSTIAGSTSKMA